jgi:hypothetical protein
MSAAIRSTGADHGSSGRTARLAATWSASEALAFSLRELPLRHPGLLGQGRERPEERPVLALEQPGSVLRTVGSRGRASLQPAAYARYFGRGAPQGTLSGRGRYLEELGVTATQVPSRKGVMGQLSRAAEVAASPDVARLYADQFRAGPALNALMLAASFVNRNRGALALGALGTADLTRLLATLNREPENVP